MNPWRCFTELLGTVKRSFCFDLKKIENGVIFPLCASGLFSTIGVSFKLSKKFMEYVEDIIDRNNNKELLEYKLYHMFYNFFSGNWSELKEYDETLTDLNLKIGEFWHATYYTYFSAFLKVGQGIFNEVEIPVRKLSDIAEFYEYELAKICQYFMKTILYVKSRRNLNDAQIETDAGISLTRKIGSEPWQIVFIGLKANIQILLKNVDGAKESLNKAKELVLKQEMVPPCYITWYLVPQFVFDIYLLEEAILSKDKSNISEYRKKARQSGKKALKNVRKFAYSRTLVFRLMGLYYWLIGRQNKAVKWWNKTIREGELLGARPDLARTYMETGKRFLEEKSKYRELNGVSAREYLEKARTMFEDMDLQWDLDELDKIVSYS